MKLIDYRKETDEWILYKLLDAENGKIMNNSDLQPVQNMKDKEKNLIMMYCDVYGFEYFEVLYRNNQIMNYMRPIKTKRAMKKYTEYMI